MVEQEGAPVHSERRANPARDPESLLHTLLDPADDGFCVIELVDGPGGPLDDYVHVSANAACAAHLGIADLAGRRMRDLAPREADGWIGLYRQVLLTGEPLRFGRTFERTGRRLDVRAVRIEPAQRRRVAVVFRDTGARNALDALERRLAEEVVKRTHVENALRQAQKMEAVGQLTGGIAHDFNNMLGVVLNAVDLLGLRMAADDEAGRTYLALAKGGVTRAAHLARRLLAFSRKQPLHPQPVAINALLRGLAPLLEHAAGAGVQLEARLDPAAWVAYVDPNQLENGILNLVVNARDAMAHGGRLTIETRNCELLQRPDAVCRDPAPGHYLMIAIRDTGAGMPPDVLGRAAEPFFTTKAPGHGTGLGLSQVVGFVRQSGGHVRIASAPDAGTVVALYLPRHAGHAPAEAAAPDAA